MSLKEKNGSDVIGTFSAEIILKIEVIFKLTDALIKLLKKR